MSIVFRKYWLLTTEYPPFYGGGISTYCHYTAKMLSEKGHDVSVFICDAAVTDIVKEVKDGIRLIRFHPSRTRSSDFLGYTTNVSYEFALVLKEFIEREGQPDIIEAQEYLGIAYYLLQFKHLQYHWCKDIPILITMHSPSFLYLEYNHVSVYRYPNYWIGEMERFSMQAADVVISPSRFLVEEIKKRFELVQPRLFIVRNPMLPLQQPGDIAPGPGQEIVFFGKLSAQKGTFRLLTYFRQLWESGFNEKLFLIGGQDIVYHPEAKTMGDVVRRQYKTYIDNKLLILEDKISPSMIRQRLEKAKVVIVPSTVDNLPYVVLEMMSMQKIVLVSRQGGQAEMIEDGVDGFVFDHEVPESFNIALGKVLQLDEAQRRQMRQRAYQKVVDCTGPDLIYKQKMDALTLALSSSGGAHQRFPFIRLRESIPVSPVADEEPGLLSIVIPYYNMGRYLQETMHSLEQVEYKHRQIIIVNDGSTDAGSLQVLAMYRGRPGVMVIDSVNKGLAAARNRGVEMARGEFLAFLDADDKVSPVYYSRAIEALRKWDNVHFAGCWTRYFEASSRTWPTFSPEPPLVLFHNTVNSSALVYKRASFLAGGLNDTGMTFAGLEDYESVVSMTVKGLGGVVLPEQLFHYRVRTDSMIRKITREKKLYLHKYICEKHSEAYARFAAELLSLSNANGPGILLDNPSLDHNSKAHLLSSKLVGVVKRNKYTRAIAYKLYKTFISKHAN